MPQLAGSVLTGSAPASSQMASPRVLPTHATASWLSSYGVCSSQQPDGQSQGTTNTATESKVEVGQSLGVDKHTIPTVIMAQELEGVVGVFNQVPLQNSFCILEEVQPAHHGRLALQLEGEGAGLAQQSRDSRAPVSINRLGNLQIITLVSGT